MSAVRAAEELARLGTATVYEASGREGLIDADLVQVVPDSRVAGPARTVRCGQDDNLMVHAVMERVRPGDVLVLTMPAPSPVALVGDLLATQAREHRERTKRAALRGGALSYDLDGLRAVVERGGGG